MGYSKRQFVEAAFGEIGLAAYVFDASPQQLEAALKRLDALMADWNGRGIRLSYPLHGDPEFSDIDAESNVPDYANEAIILNLALRLAPSYGKQVMPDTKINAKNAYNTMMARTALPMEQQLPESMPLGAGNKPWRVSYNEYVRPPIDHVLTGGEGKLEL